MTHACVTNHFRQVCRVQMITNVLFSADGHLGYPAVKRVTQGSC